MALGPLDRSYALRSPAQLIREEREKLERTIVGLEKGLLALRSQRDATAADAAAAKLDERTKAAKKLRERELELRREAAQQFASLVERWNALADSLSEQSALAAGGADLVKAVGLFDRAAVAAWENASGFVVEPVPVDLRGFLEELLEAATAERTDVEAEHLLIDGENARRRELATRDPGGSSDLPPLAYPAIRANVLHELVPDLAGTIRTANVTGAATRRRHEAPAGWPGEAA